MCGWGSDHNKGGPGVQLGRQHCEVVGWGTRLRGNPHHRLAMGLPAHHGCYGAHDPGGTH